MISFLWARAISRRHLTTIALISAVKVFREAASLRSFIHVDTRRSAKAEKVFALFVDFFNLVSHLLTFYTASLFTTAIIQIRKEQ